MENSEDPAAFHHVLHCLLRLKQPSGTVKHHNLENSIFDPLKYTMGIPILIVSICLGKSIRIQRVKKEVEYDQEMPQSHTANQPTAHEEEAKNNNSHNT